jgi:hypothetical protein
MLDDIQQTFQDETEVWDKLNKISFNYIELQNFGLSDDLYIKMNARGKPLTNFENFKAKFEQHIKKESWENNAKLTETFSHQIDTLWTDLFWNYRDKTKNVFDEQLLNFFRTMAVISYSLKAPKDDKFRLIIDLLRSSQKVSFNQYLDLGCFDEEYFKTLKSVLNKISDIADFFDWSIPMDVQKDMWERDKSGFSGSVKVSWEKDEEDEEEEKDALDILKDLEENPEFDPFNKDVLYTDKIKSVTGATRDSIKRASIDESTIKTVNFTNVRFLPGKNNTI